MLRFGGTCIGNQLNTQFVYIQTLGLATFGVGWQTSAPLTVERGKEVIDWKRNTEYVKNICNRIHLRLPKEKDGARSVLDYTRMNSLKHAVTGSPNLLHIIRIIV